ncbi:MAG: oxidoreductase [Firmicutes bacterium HGW-Firmicutes-7]|nr:MAG: oxidoreductase [Firmicutes bacterium HGW-Firmicutes-7]
MNTIRWGIIGCGDVTEVKSGPGFQKAEHSELIAVMRRQGALAEDYAKRHKVKKWFDDADALIHDPEVDIVYIATPPAYHMEYTLRCAKAGKPVYVEKPMARNYEECEAMIEACKQAKVPLFVAYYRRALPRFNKIKELIEQGKIGEVRFATITLYQKPREDEYSSETRPWRVIPELAGAGKFMDLASHTLDIFDFILGPVSEVQGIASNQAELYTAEDIVTSNLMFGSKVHGVGTWCFSAFDDYDMNEIVGSKGKLVFSTFGKEPIELITKDERQSFAIENPVHIQQPLIQTIVDELNGQGSCPSVGTSGARTNKVMDDILKKYRERSL